MLPKLDDLGPIVIPIKSTISLFLVFFFWEIERLIIQFIGKHKGWRKVKTIFIEKHNWKMHISIFPTTSERYGSRDNGAGMMTDIFNSTVQLQRMIKTTKVLMTQIWNLYIN